MFSMPYEVWDSDVDANVNNMKRFYYFQKKKKKKKKMNKQLK